MVPSVGGEVERRVHVDVRPGIDPGLGLPALVAAGCAVKWHGEGGEGSTSPTCRSRASAS